MFLLYILGNGSIQMNILNDGKQNVTSKKVFNCIYSKSVLPDMCFEPKKEKNSTIVIEEKNNYYRIT